jgi:hypothetical protein
MPNSNITCYGEFPWVFKDGKRIMFEGCGIRGM